MVKYTKKNNAGLKCFTVPSGKVVCAKKKRFKPYDIRKDNRLKSKPKKKMMATRIQQRVKKKVELKKKKKVKAGSKIIKKIKSKLKVIKAKKVLKVLKKKKKVKTAKSKVVKKMKSVARVKTAKKIVREKRAVALRKKQSDDEFRASMMTAYDDYDDYDDDYSEDSEDRFEARLRGRGSRLMTGRREMDRRVQQYKEERHSLADDPFDSD